MPATRLLVIGDIHLGRQSGRLPSGLDPSALGAAAALRLAVQSAQAAGVQAILLAGDIVDAEGDLYHALGILTEVLTPLRDQGIEVLAVAGNHDHAVLPRLARAVPGLVILGAGGRWETATVDGPGGPVRVLGWSFPREHYPLSPAADLQPLSDGPPAIGLLHADLKMAGSRYAPVSRGELARAGPCRWLLGHVHAPSLDPASTEPGYLGSLVGLDPTETGPRGPWLVEIAGPEISLRFWPQAPLRWEALEVAIDAMTSPRDELPALVVGALRGFAARHSEELQQTSVLGLRLRLAGRTPDHAALCAAIDALRREQPVLEIAPGLRAFIDRIANAGRPAHDLAQLAARDDPPGLLARELLSVQDGAATELRHLVRAKWRQIDANKNFQALAFAPAGPGAQDDARDESALTEALLSTGYLILDELLQGREAVDGSA